MNKERKTIIIIIIIFILFSYTLKLTTSIRYNLGNDSISLKIQDVNDNKNDKIQNKEDEEKAVTENDIEKNVEITSESDLHILEKINNMSETELMELDGIGEVIAKRIITYRKDNGNFKKIDDIMNINGIGQKKLENIKKDVQKSDIISN